MQVTPIVSVSTLEIGGNPRTPTHVLFSPEETTLISVEGVQVRHNPCTSTRKPSESPEKSAIGQEPRYFSVLFCEDDESVDVAWTFTMRKGEDLLGALQRYAMKIRPDTDDEHEEAFQRFATRLVIQSLSRDQGNKNRENARRDKDMDIPLEHPTGKLKTMESTKRQPGKARDEEIKLCFQQCQSPVDLVTALDRTPEFILREAERLLREAKLKQQLRWNKRGRWSDGETRWLILQRNQGLLLNKMARLLRRTKPSVDKKLRLLGTTILDSTVVEHGPQELPSRLREWLFSTRLFKIWEGLLKSSMTPTWRIALSKKPAVYWLSSVSAGIPADVKNILGGLQPPTYDKLEHLSPVISTDAGVYARLVTSRFSVQATNDRYLYVGSASKYGSGLQGKVYQHIRKDIKTRLYRNVKPMHLNAPGRFVTLMTMKTNSAKEENVFDVRRKVTLAEAILTIWLGALQSPSVQLQKLCPWNPEALDYRPWSSHNPLEEDIVLPKNATIET
ncbi:hypothetical protein GGR58DRAFT_499073 [Xylaria digitata]|nr:hypothetical protein GGR58DRAFT_499073 [Xylaria digitata]